MAGSVMVRYAKKTTKQLNYSIDIDPESISFMTFQTYEEARNFANSMQEQGNHIIEIKDDYKH